MNTITDDFERGVAVGYTLASGKLFATFDEFHKYIEKVMGHGVWTSQFMSPIWWNEIREIYENSIIEEFERLEDER